MLLAQEIQLHGDEGRSRVGGDEDDAEPGTGTSVSVVASLSPTLVSGSLWNFLWKLWKLPFLSSRPNTVMQNTYCQGETVTRLILLTLSHTPAAFMMNVKIMRVREM